MHQIGTLAGIQKALRNNYIRFSALPDKTLLSASALPTRGIAIQAHQSRLALNA
jgi:hypothetical protein